MAVLTLGLDLGPTSIGWALLDEQAGKLIDAGVRVFPEGVDRDTSGAEVSKTEQRRIARGMRRQTARRARRKAALRRALVEAGLLPEAALLAPDNPERVAWEREAYRKEDPYSLRSRALQEKLDPHQIGRAFLHLNQRRGFKSNRKTDRARKKEDSEMLAEISELADELGERTLGQFLAELRGGDPKRYHQTRLRGRHTRRAMYEREFDEIWVTQQKHHPDLLTDKLRERIQGVIFFQRPLLPPPASLIGRCELDERLPRCSRADRRAQRFRLYQEVNNVRVIDTSARLERALTAEERKKLLGYLQAAKERSFDQIRKRLFEQYDSIVFNLERGGRKKLKGLPTDAALAHKSLLGKPWRGLDETLKDRIVAAIIDDDEERLRHLLGKAGLGEEWAQALLDDVDLEEGYASYSLHAIKKLLPHLEAGLPLTSRDPDVPCALRAAGYQMPWENAVERQPFLPQPPDVTNPIVRQALHELCKLVNAILRERVYGENHTLSVIHIELAREARGTASQRQKRTRDMRQRERLRDAAADRIRETGVSPGGDAIPRYLLWQEQGETCIYSGKPISLTQLLRGEVDVDHILPYSRSLDNSMMNRVVCFRASNADKGNRTPHEWLAHSDPDAYEQVLQRARRLPKECYPKLRRFFQESVELDDFIARQLVDTTYITTQVHQYVKCLAPDVLCIRGNHTAQLRRQWGLNTILQHDDSDTKNRDDHRHHAVDAIVIALTNRSRLQQLAALQRRGGVEHTGEVLPEPWDAFRRDAEDAVNRINVSHRVRRKVAGKLHDDTIYGPTESPDEFVYRKPLDALSPAMVLKIRDEAIREIVTKRLQEHGIEPKRGAGKIPADVWREPLTMPSGIAIRKVRLVVPSESIRPIRGGRAYVQPGNAHHLCLFESGAKHGKEAVFVSMLEAIGRVRRREPIIQRTHPTRPDARFLMSLSGNELVLLDHGGKSDLYRFETAASTTGQMWFRHHTFAGKSSDKRGRVSKNPNTLKARKVVVDRLGRIRWAND